MNSTIGIHFQSFIMLQFTFMRFGNTVEWVKSSPLVNLAPGLGWVFPLKVQLYFFIYGKSVNFRSRSFERSLRRHNSLLKLHGTTSETK